MLRVAIAFAGVGCGTSAGHDRYEITSATGSFEGVAGDALELVAVERLSDGTTRDVDPAIVTWSGAPVAFALAPESEAEGSLPRFGAAATAVFARNPSRRDVEVPAGELFLLDRGWTEGTGEVHVSARITGSLPGEASATISIARQPTGNAAAGGAVYAQNCAKCHGASGHGSAVQADGSYLLDGIAYQYPAPGLNTEPGNVAGDPAWNAAMLAFASRSDMDDGAVALRAPMPGWLASSLTTQDFADIYAFLRTQNQ